MKNVLLVLGHSNYDNSLSNRTIADIAAKNSNITVRKLHEVSSGFEFDVKAEQDALAKADVVVFQFPFHWYSLPAILKKWVDDVLLFGFAYGPGGDKLKDKKVVISLTTGGPAEAYSVSGSNNYSVHQLIAPVIQTAQFCGMKVAEVVASSGMLYIPGVIGDKDEISRKAQTHGAKLLEVLEKL